MAEGKVVAEGPPDQVMNDPAVIDAYLGAHHDSDLGDGIHGLHVAEAQKAAAAVAAHDHDAHDHKEEGK
jgi:branched-chain amino acid transport system ATP-binding protein